MAFILLILLVVPLLTYKGPYIIIVMNIGLAFMVALGLGLLIGYAGQISMGHATFCGIGAYTSGIATTRFGLSPIMGLGLGVVVALAIALILSPILRLKRFFFGVSTMAFGAIMGSLFVGLRSLTGGSLGLTDIPKFSLAGFTFDSALHYYYLTWVLAFAMVWVSDNLIHSRWGRTLKAIGADETAARMMGVNATLFKISFFLVSAAFASVSGSITAHYLRVAFPDSYGIYRSVDYFMMTYMGGAQSVWGPLLGSGIVNMLSDVLQPLKDWQLLFYGAILVVILTFAPRGILGILENLFARVRLYLYKK